jgi:hypothetical protein
MPALRASSSENGRANSSRGILDGRVTQQTFAPPKRNVSPGC